MDSKNSSPWSFILPIFLLCSSLYTHLCLGTDKLDANRSISGNQTLTSSGGNFTLGFFSPGNSTYSYIGIWYNKISVQTVVWVANRDNPVTDRHSTGLKVSGGNLVIVNNSEVPVWSTNLTASSSGSSSMVAVLEDDGNFALKVAPNSSVTLWQSFDHPTHTWLPGAKLGIDKRKNTSQRLISWKNAKDPSTGLFSLHLQPFSDGEYYIWWNESNHYWTGGKWDNQTKIFSGVPEMRANYIYEFKYVDNENESYFTYSIKSSYNTISRFVMDLSGQIKQESWLPSQAWTMFWSKPSQQCEVYRLCGPFSVCSEQSEVLCSCLPRFSISSPMDWNLSDWSGGCKRNSNLNCAADVEKDRFWPMSNMKLHDDPQSLVAESDQECRTACLSNCSCTAYAFENNACSIWIGDLFNVEWLKQGTTPGRSFYVRLAASEIKDPSKKSNVIATVTGSVGAAVVILAIVLFAVWRWRRGATDSSHIAVKKLESISQGEKQFRTEVSTIGTIQHVNLVRLRGFCSEGDKRLLVYDFMPNGSLDYHLFHRKDSKALDWKTRYQIALGTARGLAYLHEKCRDCIIHCDIKPENILLDAEFCPEVADFGLAKLVGRDFSRVLTTMRGTRGYLAPEWISGVAITVKADVYSYGMMLFEFVSGRRNLELSENGAIEFFPTWAASKIAKGGDLLDLLDPDLEKNADNEELNRICRVACWCVQDEETHRPSMGQVVQVLEGLLDVNLPRIPRALQLLLDNQEHVVFFTESSSSDQNSQTNSNTSTSSLQNPNSSSSTKSES